MKFFRLNLGMTFFFSLQACGAKPPEKKPMLETTENDATAAAVELTSPFAIACDVKKRLDVFESALNEGFTYLCSADKKPSGTFVHTLASIPWTGANNLKIYRLGEPIHDNATRTTKLTGGGTVEIPITPRAYALRSADYAFDPALANRHGIKLVDGLKSDLKIAVDSANSELGLIGRVYSRLLIEKDVNHQHIVIEYEAARTSVKLSDDVYLVSTNVTKSLQGIKDMYSIGIAYPLNGKNVVTSIIMTKTDNRNQPGVAAETLLKTFREGMQNVRSNAEIMSKISELNTEDRLP